MRADLLTCLASVGLAAGHAVEQRAPAELAAQDGKKWHPITKDPSFFNLKVNVDCRYGDEEEEEEEPSKYPQITPSSSYEASSTSSSVSSTSTDDSGVTPRNKRAEAGYKGNCALQGYGIRLEDERVIATPYDRWWDPTVATFFVDDDTAMYTVSKDPLQMYINAQTGQFQYSRVGWLPAKAIGLHFFHTGRSPLGYVGKGYASSFLTWPSTQGVSPDKGTWAFCPDGTKWARTGQYQVYINEKNFASSGIDKADCLYAELVAADANPWRKKKPHYDDDKDWDDDKYKYGDDKWDDGKYSDDDKYDSGDDKYEYGDDKKYDYKDDYKYGDDKYDYKDDYKYDDKKDDYKYGDKKDDYKYGDKKDDYKYGDDKKYDYKDDYKYGDKKDDYKDDYKYGDDKKYDYKDDYKYGDDKYDYKDDYKYGDKKDDYKYGDDKKYDYKDDKKYDYKEEY